MIFRLMLNTISGKELKSKRRERPKMLQESWNLVFEGILLLKLFKHSKQNLKVMCIELENNIRKKDEGETAKTSFYCTDGFCRKLCLQKKRGNMTAVSLLPIVVFMNTDL